MNEKQLAFQRLLDIMDKLRENCPWDKKQTLESLRTLTIEETFELADAIMKQDLDGIKKELGDLFLHIVFYAKIGEEKNAFNITDVLNGICEKLIYRHPHVFSDTTVKNADEVVSNWEQLKLKEKDGNKSVLSGIPNSLSALVKANRIQEKVRGVGFDWEERTQVWDKLKEEFDELQTEIEKMDTDKIEAEFGDLLFSLVNTARLYGINPENALQRTNEKFTKRFNYLETKTIKQGINLNDLTLAEMDVIWEEAKQFDL